MLENMSFLPYLQFFGALEIMRNDVERWLKKYGEKFL